MVYDCFLFFNELDLLDLRLHELSAVVDRFVLVEATRTHQNRPKPLYFSENQQRFEKFLPRITQIVVDQHPGFWRTLLTEHRRPTPKDHEVNERNAISRGLCDCAPGDTIIVSDIDEIPRPALVLEFQDTPGVKTFDQTVFNHFFNCMNVTPGYRWRGSVMVDFQEFTSGQDLRRAGFSQCFKTPGDVTVIHQGGWHFSYLGGVDSLITKIESFSHAEVNRDEWKNRENISAAIRDGRDIFRRDYQFQFVPLDESFPAYLREHPERFGPLIWSPAEERSLD